MQSIKHNETPVSKKYIAISVHTYKTQYPQHRFKLERIQKVSKHSPTINYFNGKFFKYTVNIERTKSKIWNVLQKIPKRQRETTT